MDVNRRQVTAGLTGALVGAVAIPRIARAQGEPIRIGVISSLSGPAQIYGDANRIGAEIAARVAREGFWDLDAPIERVGAAFTPPPYAPELERAWLPGRREIADAIRRLAAV